VTIFQVADGVNVRFVWFEFDADGVLLPPIAADRIAERIVGQPKKCRPPSRQRQFPNSNSSAKGGVPSGLCDSGHVQVRLTPIEGSIFECAVIKSNARQQRHQRFVSTVSEERLDHICLTLRTRGVRRLDHGAVGLVKTTGPAPLTGNSGCPRYGLQSSCRRSDADRSCRA